jgi:hypothetical protein
MVPDGAGGWSTDPLDSFSSEIRSLVKEVCEYDGFDSKDRAPMKVVAKVCCTHFSVLRRFASFDNLCESLPKLLRSMLHYTAFHGSDLLSTDPRTGDQVLINY